MYKKGQLLNGFAHLRDDGTTTSGNWLYVGQWTEKGNQTANRDNSDPSGLGAPLVGALHGLQTVVYFIAVHH